MKPWTTFLLLAAALFPIRQATGGMVDLKSRTLVNPTPYIPAQCYAVTREAGKKPIRNPCYVCHTRSLEPNYVNDQALQKSSSFPAAALENPWTNLLKDRGQRTRAISDAWMQNYIRHDNYFDDQGRIILAKRLHTPPGAWDYNGNGHWDGYVPDCFYHFDRQGFDRTPEGGYSGWRAFAYFPFPGLSWPVNGSADDVLIRLAEPFRRDEKGQFDIRAYRLNLAIIEALIRRCDVAIDPVDEQKYGVDLDRDGKLGRATRIVFSWAPLNNRTMSFVGQARLEQAAGRIHLAAGLFPEGTEFLSSLHYLDPGASTGMPLSRRFKELRYMKKRNWLSYSDLEEATLNEVKERSDFPDRIRLPMGDPERGVSNGRGWIMQGFIEDRDGSLRPQSFEETASCIGCHGGIGATTDSVFAFSRKLNSGHFRRGWFHWSFHGLAGLAEPKVGIRSGGVYYEYSYYLMYNRAVDDFRANRESRRRFFNPDGTVRPAMLDLLHDDIASLLYPSPEQAMRRNKCYLTIVLDQDFIHGREALTAPADGVLTKVRQDQATGVVRPTSIDAFRDKFGATDSTAHGNAAKLRQDAVQEKIRRLTAPGLHGPNGRLYEVNWSGTIRKSSYSVPGIYFPFPRRLTMPTRIIIPPGGNPICARCHKPKNADLPGSVSLRHSTEAAGIRQPLPAGMRTLTIDPSSDIGGRWSPDGHSIVFVSNRSGSSQLWLWEDAGSRCRRLTSGPRIAAWPQWSPDGHSIVFWSHDPASGESAIETIRVADGTTDLDRKILVRNQDGLARPTFHPSGRSIAYAATPNGNWDIWLVDTATGQRRRLTRGEAMETNPRWRPDGRVLAYKVAPKGKYPLTEEYFMSFVHGLENPIIHRWNGPRSIQMNDWSPDGRKITYTAEIISDSSGRDRVTYAAMVSDLVLNGESADTRNTRILSRGRTLGDRGPVFSPDGRSIAFWAWDTEANATLWCYDLDNDRLTRITRGGPDMYPSWNPAGDRLLFTTQRTGNNDLALLSLP